MHLFWISRPVPRQRGQVRATLKKPCWKVTWPAPPQVLQVLGLEPAAAPEPLQAVQDSTRGICRVASVPKAASSKPSSRL